MASTAAINWQLNQVFIMTAAPYGLKFRLCEPCVRTDEIDGSCDAYPGGSEEETGKVESRAVYATV